MQWELMLLLFVICCNLLQQVKSVNVVKIDTLPKMKQSLASSVNCISISDAGHLSCSMTHVCLDFAEKQFVVNSNPELHNTLVYSRDSLNAGTKPWKIVHSKDMPQEQDVVSGTYLVVERYASNNWGHVLGDEVFAAFNALNLWNMTQQSPINILTDFATKSLDVYDSILDGHVSTYPPSARADDPNKMLCFEKVVAGLK